MLVVVSRRGSIRLILHNPRIESAWPRKPRPPTPSDGPQICRRLVDLHQRQRRRRKVHTPESGSSSEPDADFDDLRFARTAPRRTLKICAQPPELEEVVFLQVVEGEPTRNCWQPERQNSED